VEELEQHKLLVFVLSFSERGHTCWQRRRAPRGRPGVGRTPSPSLPTHCKPCGARERLCRGYPSSLARPTLQELRHAGFALAVGRERSGQPRAAWHCWSADALRSRRRRSRWSGKRVAKVCPLFPVQERGERAPRARIGTVRGTTAKSHTTTHSARTRTFSERG